MLQIFIHKNVFLCYNVLQYQRKVKAAMTAKA